MGIGYALNPQTEALKITAYAHHEIHSGNHFYYNTTSNLGSAATANFFVITPDTTKWTHMAWNFSSLEDTHIIAWEGVDGTTSAALTLFNSNRNSSTTPGLIMAPVASITTQGTLMWQDFIPADKFGAGQTRADSEIVLKQNTIYNMRIISKAASNIITTKLFWYELIDKSGTVT